MNKGLPGLRPCLARSWFALELYIPYYGRVVQPPFINLEEEFDKIVGRRLKPPDPLSVQTSRKADAIAWRKWFGGVRVPRGVHRFRTHEEADEWLWRMIARPNPS